MKKLHLLPSFAQFIFELVSKKHIFILIFGVFCMSLMANPKLASKQQIGMFINSKTCVVLENGSIAYNVYVKNAVEKYWKATQYEFIDFAEFEKRRFDSKYSFLVLTKGVFDKDPGGISYNYISLLLGSTETDITNMPELCSIPISYSNDNNIEYGYAIPSILKFMQNHAKKLETRRFLISIEGFKYYNGSQNFKNKVLLLNKTSMSPDAYYADQIKIVYPYFFKLLSTKEIETELESNPTNTLFNFHVGPTLITGSGKCFDMIFDVEGTMYYYNSRFITNETKDGFNLNDLRNIR